MVQPLWTSVWGFLKNLEIAYTWPRYTIPRLSPKDSTSYHRETRSSMFTAALFTIARKWKQPGCPAADEGMLKMWLIHTVKYY